MADDTDPNDSLLEMAEDTCDVRLPDGTVCGKHVGYGIRLMHLRRCDFHAPSPEPPKDGTSTDA